MGLDMYLTAERYLSAYNDDDQRVSQGVSALIPNLKQRVRKIEADVAYWRKANHIHAWFVMNVQDGKDECEKTYVPIEKLRELLAICKEILADRNKAPQLLPTQSGFFFGSTEYGEWYFENIEHTIKMLEDAEDMMNDSSFWDLYYQSSW